MHFTSIAQINVVPMPAEVKINPGYCIIKEPVGFILITYDDDNNNGVGDFEKYISKQYGIKKITEGDTHSYGLPTEFIYSTPDKKSAAGSYEIQVTGQKVYIKAGSQGTFYAFETIKQLISKNRKGELIIPHCIIKDHPRFPYRGMHLDVSRHFFTVPEVKKYIDYLAAYKFNEFHWHLTDDQGWRIEIKKYPLLTQVGACRAQTLVGNYGSAKYDGQKYCGYYTQAQVRDVVRYAKERYINIIPEIEMPGHSLAALAAYPFLGCTKGPYKTMETWGVSDDVLCAGNDSTYQFMEDVLDEVCALFPSPYIHIGGDECPKEKWKTCPVCRLKIKNEKLKDENALQSYFVGRIEKYLALKGKKIIGWDEILEGGLAPNATVMSWQGAEGGIAAAKQGHDVIMTPQSHCYFDRSQSANEDSITFGGYTPLEKIYAYEPVPASLSADEARHILGAQGNVWTEYISNEKKLEYMIFPRMAALAEVLWSPKENRNWKDFERRLPAIFKSYTDRGIHFSNAYNDLGPSVIPLPGNSIGWQLETKNRDAHIIYREPGNEKNMIYKEPPVISKTGVFEAALTDDKNKLISNWVRQEFFINKATGKKIRLVIPASESYPGSGAFSLVDGVQNTKGMARSAEFLGFNGKDLDALIDLGEEITVNRIALHIFQQPGSWIYPPASVQVYFSSDGTRFSKPVSCSLGTPADSPSLLFILRPENTQARYIRVLATNYGLIPSGQPGAGNPAWLFADEIEVQ